MAHEEKDPEDIGGKWVTVRGKKIHVQQGQDTEDAIREELPSLRGEKEKNTKQAQDTEHEKFRKSFVYRADLQKTPFSFREQVIYDKFTKSGIVAGFNGGYVEIFDRGRKVTIPQNNVFKASELIGNVHWDAISISERQHLLQKSGVSANYLKHDWAGIPAPLRDKLQKGTTPAGTGISTGTSGVWNPVNTDVSVDTKLKNEKKK